MSGLGLSPSWCAILRSPHSLSSPSASPPRSLPLLAFQSPTCQLTRSKQQQRHSSSCSDREVTLGVHRCHTLE